MKRLGRFFSITDALLCFWRCSKGLEMAIAMLPWCFSVLFCDGCVRETLLKPEVFLLFRSQNLQVSPAQEKTLSAETPEKAKGEE